MANFLFVHQNFPAQFRHLALALAEQNHNVTALGMKAKPEQLQGVRYIQHQAAVPSAARAGLLQLRDLGGKVLRGESAAESLQHLKESGYRPDVIYVHPGWGEGLFLKDVFPSAKIVVYAEYYYGTDDGDSFFDVEFSSPKTLRSLQNIRLRNTHLLHAISSADIGISPTEFQRTQHPEWFAQRTRVIHDGIDTQRFVPSRNAQVTLARTGIVLRPGDEVITFVARNLEPYRGYHTFMRSLPMLLRLRPQARVVIVGGDGTSYGAAPPKGQTWKKIFLDEVVDELDVSRVHFVGKLPHELLTQLMQVSAVYTYLTYPFVLSWSLLEAMSVGCLVVASKTAPVAEVISHGDNGLLVDFFDTSALAQALASAAANRHRLSYLRDAARKTVIDRFDLFDRCLPMQIQILSS